MSGQRNQSGFTLIELLVVIAIIAILAAILFPVFAKAREKARQTTCSNNQRQIATAILMYAQDYGECLPGVAADRIGNSADIWGALHIDGGTLVCPTLGNHVKNGYGYNGHMSGVALGDIPDPVTAMITADSHAADNVIWTGYDLDIRHDSSTIRAYADGHVELVKGRSTISMPTNDLLADLPVGTIPDTAGGWSRGGCVDTNWNYTTCEPIDPAAPSEFFGMNGTDGSPDAPCMELAVQLINGSRAPSYNLAKFRNNAPVTKYWALAGRIRMVNMMPLTNVNQQLGYHMFRIRSNAVTFKVQRFATATGVSYTINNTTNIIPNLTASLTARPEFEGYLDQWLPFTIECNGNKMLFNMDGKIFEAGAFVAGANLRTPTILDVNVDTDNVASKIRLRIDDLRFSAL